MKPIDGYFLIKPEELAWRPSNLMKIPNADSGTKVDRALRARLGQTRSEIAFHLAREWLTQFDS